MHSSPITYAGSMQVEVIRLVANLGRADHTERWEHKEHGWVISITMRYKRGSMYSNEIVCISA